MRAIWFKKSGPLEAERRIRACAEKGGDALDLSGLTLSAWPDSLFELKGLKELRIGPDRWARAEPSVAPFTDPYRFNYLGPPPIALSAALPELEALDVGSNPLGPEGAAALRGLERLISLDIDGCAIGDDGLKALSAPSNLRRLNVGGNALSASGVEAFAAPPRLERLVIRGAGLDAAAAAAIARCAGLKALDVAGNKLGPDGARALRPLQSLEELSISSNALEGVGLRALGDLSALTTLDVAYNHIGDEDAAALGVLTGLTALRAENNALSDGAARVLAEFGALRHLELWHNDIEDLGAQAIGTMTSLERLDLSVNGFGAEGAMALARLPALKSLNLNVNHDLGEEVAAELSERADLEELRLSGCGIGEEGVRTLMSLARLTTLELGGEPVGDDGARRIAQIGEMAALDLGGAGLTAEGAAALGALTELRRLDLSDNAIDGLDLNAFAGLTKLEFLSLGQARVNAPDPGFWRRETLQDVRFQAGRLIGAPPEILAPPDGPQNNRLPALRAHFEDLEGGAASDREATLVLLGGGWTDRATILSRLAGRAIKPMASLGLRIETASLEGDPLATRLRIRDFGGGVANLGAQMHFMAQPGGMLALVWTPEAAADGWGEDDAQLSIGYWLRLIATKAAARPAPPLILICDPKAPPPPPERIDALRDRFDFLRVVAYDVARGDGAEELRDALQEASIWLCGPEPVSIGAGRAAVIAELERRSSEQSTTTSLRAPSLSRDAFADICETTGADAGGVSDLNEMLEFLRRREKLAIDGRRLAFDSAWVHKSAYAVVDPELKLLERLKRHHGWFTRQDVAETLLPDPDFSDEERRQLLWRVGQCGLAHVRCGLEGEDKQPDACFVFSLLPDKETALADVSALWDQASPIQSDVLAFDSASPLLLPALTATPQVFNAYSQHAIVWRNGFYLTGRLFGERRLVELNRADSGAVEIAVSAQNEHSWYTLRSNIVYAARRAGVEATP